MSAATSQWDRRRALERQLHDGPALRLAALCLRLGLLTHRFPALACYAELQGELHLALGELRAVAEQLYPPLLHEEGLGPAIHELAGQLRIPVRLEVPAARFDPAAEGVAYYAVRDTLAGLAPTTRTVDIVVRQHHHALTLDVGDQPTIKVDLACE